ncbi:hypothetical protein ART_0826 [Arthrobacter sp. PAMC 25486]|uniref:multicopper oxidase domain-containing protein n=1 Tax=Arthrobacter sp. PAMC 25486 TaxID=1494608 RepID=UPI000535BC6E|nr:hypothetical protein ART_0826 [Arthrobacter sp. PAMC 25486]
MNALSEATSIHWHGLALRNNDDGVPGSREDVKAGPSESMGGMDHGYMWPRHRRQWPSAHGPYAHRCCQ